MGNSEKTIFIAIGSYNESYLEQTVENCIKMAKHPSRLVFGIWAHNNDGVTPDMSKFNNVKIKKEQSIKMLLFKFKTMKN